MAPNRPAPAPCLLLLRSQVDARWPGRLKASDGIMGDASHLLRRSDHNVGNAIDLTHSPGHLDAGVLAEEFRRQMSRNAGGRITYIIYRRQITSSLSHWKWVKYSRPNPHISHVHISIRASARDVLRPWTLP